MISPRLTALAAVLVLAFAPSAHANKFPGIGPIPPPRPANVGSPAAPLPDAAASPEADAATLEAATPANAATADVPVPRPRPPQFDRMAALPPASTPVHPEQLPGSGASFCAALLASGRVDGKVMPKVTGDGGCGIESPIQLTAIFLGDGTRIPVEPASLMRCQLADALAIWVRTDVATAAEKAGSKLARIQSAAAYVCRGRNRIAGAMMSEHGLGNAFDLRGVTLASGRMLTIDKSAESRPFMEVLRSSACARFKTILGPGSDGYHEDHLHVDLRERRGKSSFCQWTLR
jgi:hypothetical protein